MSVNKIILLGFVGKTPEIRSTNDGKEIANFSIATSEKWKNKDGESKSKTEWHKICIFSQGLVSVVKQYVKKGTRLYIEGSVQTRKWTDGKGIDRTITEIVLQGFNSTLKILSSKGDEQAYKDESLEDTVKREFTGVSPIGEDEEIQF